MHRIGFRHLTFYLLLTVSLVSILAVGKQEGCAHFFLNSLIEEEEQQQQHMIQSFDITIKVNKCLHLSPPEAFPSNILQVFFGIAEKETMNLYND